MMETPFLPHPEPIPGARIKVVGVGGAGCNAVNRMIESGVSGVEFIAMNTDQQSLSMCQAPHQIILGPSSMRGLGAGGNSDRGYVAAEESRDEILKQLEGSDMIFITAGMGGGTGTGAAPVVANYAKELNALTVAVVLTPFAWEGKSKIDKAHKGLEKLRSVADTVIAVSNERLKSLCPQGATQKEVFRTADSVLIQGVRGIADLILYPGDLNGDFADVENVLRNGGEALIGTGTGRGENGILDALQQALACPLLERSQNGSARKVIVSMMANWAHHQFSKVEDAMTYLQEHYAGQSEVKLCQVEAPQFQDEVQITVLASGFDEAQEVPVFDGRTTRQLPAFGSPRSSSLVTSRAVPRASSNTLPFVPMPPTAPITQIIPDSGPVYGHTQAQTEPTGDEPTQSSRTPRRLDPFPTLAPTSSGEVHGDLDLEIPAILRNKPGQLPLD